MPFNSPLRLNILDRPRLRGYIHSSHIGDISQAQAHFSRSLRSLLKDGYLELKPDDRTWLLGILWRDAEHRSNTIDFFHYRDYHGWPGNPDVVSYIVCNGLCVPGRPITCTEGLVLLGEEERLRRQTGSLEEYLSSSVDLSRVNQSL